MQTVQHSESYAQGVGNGDKGYRPCQEGEGRREREGTQAASHGASREKSMKLQSRDAWQERALSAQGTAWRWRQMGLWEGVGVEGL